MISTILKDLLRTEGPNHKGTPLLKELVLCAGHLRKGMPILAQTSPWGPVVLELGALTPLQLAQLELGFVLARTSILD